MKSRSRPGRPIGWSLNSTRSRKICRPAATTIEDQLSFALFPAIARDFFEAREKGDLTSGTARRIAAKGPAVAHELHLAPAEFNVTVHGETYHVKVSGSGRKTDGRKPYYIRVNDKLEEVSLEPIQEVLAGVPEAQDTGPGKAQDDPSRPSRATSRLPCRAGSSRCWSRRMTG